MLHMDCVLNELKHAKDLHGPFVSLSLYIYSPTPHRCSLDTIMCYFLILYTPKNTVRVNNK